MNKKIRITGYNLQKSMKIKKDFFTVIAPLTKSKKCVFKPVYSMKTLSNKEVVILNYLLN